MLAVYSSSPPLDDVYRQLLNFIQVYEYNGSGWVFLYFTSLKLTLWHLDPLRASAFVSLPRWIQDKRAVVNVVGTGNDCFKWAVLAGLHPVDKYNNNPNRMNNYEEHVAKNDFSSICFPVALSSIGSFAAKNDLSINVYGVDNDNKVIYHLRVSQTIVPNRHVDLLPYEFGGIRHYSTISKFSRLVCNQFNNHNGATHFCKKCLHVYSTADMLENHGVNGHHAQRTKFQQDSKCRFTNVQNQLPAHFVAYADFESILQPVGDGVDVIQGVGVGVESSTTAFQEHVPCSFAFKIVSSIDPNFSRPLVTYRGKDAAETFVRKLQLEADQLFDEYIATPKPMLLTAKELRAFTATTT